GSEYFVIDWKNNGGLLDVSGMIYALKHNLIVVFKFLHHRNLTEFHERQLIKAAVQCSDVNVFHYVFASSNDEFDFPLLDVLKWAAKYNRVDILEDMLLGQIKDGWGDLVCSHAKDRVVLNFMKAHGCECERHNKK